MTIILIATFPLTACNKDKTDNSIKKITLCEVTHSIFYFAEILVRKRAELLEITVFVKTDSSVIFFKNIQLNEVIVLQDIGDQLCSDTKPAVILMDKKPFNIAFIHTNKTDDQTVYLIYINF